MKNLNPDLIGTGFHTVLLSVFLCATHDCVLKGQAAGEDKEPQRKVEGHSRFLSVYQNRGIVFTLLYSYNEEGMATHSNILACRIPWTEEPGRTT